MRRSVRIGDCSTTNRSARIGDGDRSTTRRSDRLGGGEAITTRSTSSRSRTGGGDGDLYSRYTTTQLA